DAQKIAAMQAEAMKRLGAQRTAWLESVRIGAHPFVGRGGARAVEVRPRDLAGDLIQAHYARVVFEFYGRGLASSGVVAARPARQKTMPGTRPGVAQESRRSGKRSRRRGVVPVLDQVLFLLLVARRQLEQARRGAAEDVVLGLLRQERQVVDGARQVEVPV